MPLMTERMVEALEIEGKPHEVHWYDEEGHGWERRENRRDAFEADPRVPPDPRPRRAAEAIASGPDVPPSGLGVGWRLGRPARRRFGITLIEPSVSRTASRTSSMLASPCARTAVRTSSLRRFSSRMRLAQEPAVADQQPRLAFDRLAHALRSGGQRGSVPLSRPSEGQDGDEPAPHRRVLADHRVLDRVRDEEDDDELEDRHLADLALARERRTTTRKR